MLKIPAFNISYNLIKKLIQLQRNDNALGLKSWCSDIALCNDHGKHKMGLITQGPVGGLRVEQFAFLLVSGETLC